MKAVVDQRAVAFIQSPVNVWESLLHNVTLVVGNDWTRAVIWNFMKTVSEISLNLSHIIQNWNP